LQSRSEIVIRILWNYATVETIILTISLPTMSEMQHGLGDFRWFLTVLLTYKCGVYNKLKLFKLPKHRYVYTCYAMLKSLDFMGHINWIFYLRKIPYVKEKNLMSNFLFFLLFFHYVWNHNMLLMNNLFVWMCANK
jgi:hypothetical protein